MMSKDRLCNLLRRSVAGITRRRCEKCVHWYPWQDKYGYCELAMSDPKRYNECIDCIFPKGWCGK